MSFSFTGQRRWKQPEWGRLIQRASPPPCLPQKQEKPFGFQASPSLLIRLIVSLSDGFINWANYAGCQISISATAVSCMYTHYCRTRIYECGCDWSTSTPVAQHCFPVCFVRVSSRPICVVSVERISQVIDEVECYFYLLLSSLSHFHWVSPSLWPPRSAFLFTDSTCFGSLLSHT